MGDVVAFAVGQVGKFGREKEGVDMIRKTLQTVFIANGRRPGLRLLRCGAFGLAFAAFVFIVGLRVREHHGRSRP